MYICVICRGCFLYAHRITLHSTREIFDPSQYSGLPLNIMALMPVLVYHFDSPTEHCIKVVSNIQQVCHACTHLSTRMLLECSKNVEGYFMLVYFHLLYSMVLLCSKHSLIMYVYIQACTSVNLSSEEAKTKLVHMSKMFQMYATKDFINGCDVWLAGICRYLSDAYVPLAAQVS